MGKEKEGGVETIPSSQGSPWLALDTHMDHPIITGLGCMCHPIRANILK
jgi:hypothetical protein